MVTVAPRNPVAVLNPCHARIVFIFGLYHVRIPGLELDWLMLYFPVDAVLAETGKDIHLHSSVVAAEDAGKTIAERNDRAVEYAVGRRDCITVDYWIAGITPQGVCAAFGSFFPGHVSDIGFHCFSVV